MWLRSMLRRGTRPVRVASCSRISTQGASRAARARSSASRAWKTSALTFSRRTPSTAAICSCDSSPSSKRTSAARWSSGRRCSSSTRSRRSARCWICAAMPWNGASPTACPSTETCARCARRAERQRLRAIVYSHGRSSIVARAAAQRPVGGGEGLLQGVLRLLATAQHVAAEREQAAVVAVVDDLEGVVVAGAHASDESIVADTQQPPPARRLVETGRGPRWRPSAQVCATGAPKCKSSKSAPDLPARHGGQPAGSPGRRSGACWGCDAGARCIRARTKVRPARPLMRRRMADFGPPPVR